MSWDIGVNVILFFVLLMMFIPMWRLVMRPCITDKLLALNALTTEGILVMVLLAMKPGYYSYLDVALVYALFGLVTMLGISLYLQRGLR